jgi:ferrous iron transport protein B
MPAYRLPTLRNVFYKSWFRVREFVVEAWPILILGSIVLALMVYYRISVVINLVVRPLTWILGLPAGTGVPLVFGVLRKELSLIMLQQALGVKNFAAVLDTVQMVTFTVFVVFYIPCLATLAVLRRELGTRDMLVISLITIVIATFAALLARGITWLMVVT